jgi:copper chaperone CopZ
MQTINIQIDGMSCGHCLNAVRQALSETEGVRVNSVQMGRATVSFDETVTDPSGIEAAITNAGYPASVLPAK